MSFDLYEYCRSAPAILMARSKCSNDRWWFCNVDRKWKKLRHWACGWACGSSTAY